MKRTRVLGIDLGLKRTGLALSDEFGLSVSLLHVVQAKNQKEALSLILDICDQWDVGVILIGVPSGKSKSALTIVRRAMSLAKALKGFFPEGENAVEIILWDESFSSRMAMERLVQTGVKRKKRAQKLDSASAAMLVEEYLSMSGSKA